ncbi:MAG TPA: hypothetical protein VFB70_02825, partial [Pyrinomonadaceae bacterium]|nr:hypothetical protein [Pyrinomonadaceae bacterium]
MENQATDVANETKQTEARETTVPDKLMQRLLNFEPTPAPVISLYLDARVNETGQRTFMPFVRKQLNERSKSYDSEERQSIDEDFVRITRYLETQMPDNVQGLAIFACSAA